MLKLGQIVIYETDVGDGILSPAVVLRTVATQNAVIHERHKPTQPGSQEPIDLLTDASSVDLCVFGLIRTYRRYNVPAGPNGGPGTWRVAGVV